MSVIDMVLCLLVHEFSVFCLITLFLIGVVGGDFYCVYYQKRFRLLLNYG